jgi:hypothetical protein
MPKHLVRTTLSPTDTIRHRVKCVKRLALCLTAGVAAVLVLLCLPVLAQQDALGIFFLFDLSGSMSQGAVDSQLRHGAETAALLSATERAGGGVFSDTYQVLAPLGSPVVASQAFTNAQGTVPRGGSDLLEGLVQAETQLGAWAGEKVVLIYGDGCTSSETSVRNKIQELQSAGYLVAYVQVENGCSSLEDVVDLYYPPSSLPTPEELILDIQPVPVSVEGAVYSAYRGELLNIKWNLPITVTWSDDSQTFLSSSQKEYEVSWGNIQPDPGDGSTLLYFKSTNDTGAPLHYTVPFTWQGVSSEHTVVVAEGGLYDHLAVVFPPGIRVGQPFSFAVSIADAWGNEPAVPPPPGWSNLYRLGGSVTHVRPLSWQWQVGPAFTQEFSATAELAGSESLQFALESSLQGWSNQFDVTVAPPGPYRTYLPVVMRNHSSP